MGCKPCCSNVVNPTNTGAAESNEVINSLVNGRVLSLQIINILFIKTFINNKNINCPGTFQSEFVKKELHLFSIKNICFISILSLELLCRVSFIKVAQNFLHQTFGRISNII